MQIVRGGKVSRLHYLLVIRGKLSRLYSNSKYLIIKRKKFAGKPSQLEANPRKPRKFSTANDLHYTVYHFAQPNNDCSIRVYWSFITMYLYCYNIYFTLPYYAGIMINTCSDLLCPKLCWHNRRISIQGRSNVFTTGHVKCNPEEYVSNQMCGQLISFQAHYKWRVCLLQCAVLGL